MPICDDIDHDALRLSSPPLQDTILNSLSPRTCELLRSGLPPLGDTLIEPLNDQLHYIAEANTSEENPSSSSGSVILNNKPLEFYSLIKN